MTPKEKAKQLVEKFTNLYEGINLGFAKKHWAKQSALIAVDEILKAVNDPDDTFLSKDGVDYWEEVKQEIENL
jgi:hypothetical protein